MANPREKNPKALKSAMHTSILQSVTVHLINETKLGITMQTYL